MKPEKILLIHLKRVGDILLTTPAISYLRRLFPKAQIDYLVYPEYADILEGNPNLSRVIPYPKSAPWRLPGLLAWRYDWVIDFLANGASAWASFFSRARRRIAFYNGYPALIHNFKIPRPKEILYAPLHKLDLIRRALTALDLAAPAPPPNLLLPQLFINQDKKKTGLAALEKDGLKISGRPLVMISPTSRRVTRCWRADGFAEVARRLAQENGATVACLWGPLEQEEARHIVTLAGHPDVRLAPEFAGIQDLGGYLAHADGLITNCNGTRHVATALAIPTLSIHMSSDPCIWNPPNPAGSGFHPRHPVIRLEKLFCIACNKNACPYNLECSTQLQTNAVLQEAKNLLAFKD